MKHTMGQGLYDMGSSFESMIGTKLCVCFRIPEKGDENSLDNQIKKRLCHNHFLSLCVDTAPNLGLYVYNKS